MPFSQTIQNEVAKEPMTLGRELGRRAVKLDFSVSRIAKATGATRQTVYHWICGNDVSPAYRRAVRNLIDILNKHQTAEKAWREACEAFDLTT